MTPETTPEVSEEPKATETPEVTEPTENPNGLTFNLTGMKSIATNYPLSFYLENQSTSLKQEGYRSDDPEQTYLSTFPAAHPDGLTKLHGIARSPARLDRDRQGDGLRREHAGPMAARHREGCPYGREDRRKWSISTGE